MNIDSAIRSKAEVENAGGQHSLVFRYTSSIGNKIEKLSIHVPIAHGQASPNDEKALLEAVRIQGGLGQWVQREDGSVWLTPAADAP